MHTTTSYSHQRSWGDLLLNPSISDQGTRNKVVIFKITQHQSLAIFLFFFYRQSSTPQNNFSLPTASSRLPKTHILSSPSLPQIKAKLSKHTLRQWKFRSFFWGNHPLRTQPTRSSLPPGDFGSQDAHRTRVTWFTHPSVTNLPFKFPGKSKRTLQANTHTCTRRPLIAVLKTGSCKYFKSGASQVWTLNNSKRYLSPNPIILLTGKI